MELHFHVRWILIQDSLKFMKEYQEFYTFYQRNGIKHRKKEITT